MRTPLLIATALLLAACGKSADEVAVSAMTGGKVDKDGDKMTIQTDQGAVTYNAAEGQALPASFPKDVYLPKDYTVQSTMDMAGALNVQLVVPGKAGGEFAAAGAAMPGMGWKQQVSMQQDGTSILVFDNDKQMVQYSFTDDESGKGLVNVTVTKK